MYRSETGETKKYALDKIDLKYIIMCPESLIWGAI